MITQRVAVSGFLLHKGKALIVRRSKTEKFFPGYYELPGGKVEFQENPYKALEREFFEETNLEVQAIKPYRVFTYGDKTLQMVEIVFLVKLDDDIANLRLSDEHDQFQWITQDQIDEFELSKEIKTNILEGFKHY